MFLSCPVSFLLNLGQVYRLLVDESDESHNTERKSEQFTVRLLLMVYDHTTHFVFLLRL